ncbi:hypothetical protein ACO0LB_01350 [Undibacterium sp. SXout7W]|uniref:hypothetical protein n=1 Tax=Undibacterium sp. SXout7W TaxID=3413049 RepID=UPI003BF33795
MAFTSKPTGADNFSEKTPERAFEHSGTPPFEPLHKLLKKVNPEKLIEARNALSSMNKEELILRFNTAFRKKQRLNAFVLSEVLTATGVPPESRRSHSKTAYSIEQEFDLLTYDLRWLRSAYPKQSGAIKYERFREAFSRDDTRAHKAAEYIFYFNGKERRATWKIVKALAMTDEMCFDCYQLKSQPVKKREEATREMRNSVFSKLEEYTRATRLTRVFTKEDAKATLNRRMNLWVCERMSDGTNREITRRYQLLTGQVITAQIASRQLGIVREILKKSRSENRAESETQNE